MLSMKQRTFNIFVLFFSLNLYLLHFVQRPNVLSKIDDILRFKNFLCLLHSM